MFHFKLVSFVLTLLIWSDHVSVMQLNEKFGHKDLNWFVGLGTFDWFHSCGITSNVHELNWWERKELKNIDYVFTPSQHWCGRELNDRCKVKMSIYLIDQLVCN